VSATKPSSAAATAACQQIAMARDATFITPSAIYLFCAEYRLSPASFHDSSGGSRVKQRGTITPLITPNFVQDIVNS